MALEYVNQAAAAITSKSEMGPKQAQPGGRWPKTLEKPMSVDRPVM